MEQVFGRTTLYEIAEYAITGLVLIFGWRYLREIIEVVFGELYAYFIQGQRFLVR